MAAMQPNSRSLVAMIKSYLLTADGGFFNFRKYTEILKEGI